MVQMKLTERLGYIIKAVLELYIPHGSDETNEVNKKAN